MEKNYKQKIALAVVEQFMNMLQNDVIEGNRFESFEGWLADGEVFELNGMSDIDVKVAMMYAKEIADDIDALHWKFAQMCGTE